ncbi:hypothetical protein D3C73_1557030 [compost metagenome]
MNSVVRVVFLLNARDNPATSALKSDQAAILATYKYHFEIMDFVWQSPKKVVVMDNARHPQSPSPLPSLQVKHSGFLDYNG